MHFATVLSLAFLALSSATRATPVVRSAVVGTDGLAERALVNIKDVVVDLGTTTLAAKVLVGPSTCPSVEGDVNARAFAVVNLGETLTLSNAVVVKDPLGLLDVRTTTKATVKVDALVCVCARVGVTLGAGDIAGVDANAIADIKAALGAGAVLNLLNAVGATLNLSLQPNSQTSCTCSGTNQYVTCANGQCGCATCPAGTMYNPATGTCTMAASPGARRRALGAAGHNSPRAQATQHRQAKKADVVERMRQVRMKA